MCAVMGFLNFGCQKCSMCYMCLHRDAFLNFDIVGPLANLLDHPEIACRKNVHRALNRIAEFPLGEYCFLYFCFKRKHMSEASNMKSSLFYRSSIYGE